jgi:hypothetical protein
MTSPVDHKDFLQELPPLDLKALYKSALDVVACRVCQKVLGPVPFALTESGNRRLFCDSKCFKRHAETQLMKATDMFKKMAMKKKSTHWSISRSTKQIGKSNG